MQAAEIALQRFYHQSLSPQMFDNPAETVGWLGAVQSQDYAGAKWAVGQRTHGANETLVEQACTNGAILRTHVMRPTWHFVTPADICWILMLTAPRVHALNAYMYRQSELDEPLLRQSTDILIEALRGGNHLTRAELAVILAQTGIIASGFRLSYIMMYAELEAVICSGAMRGKQFTYALIDERAPAVPALSRDEALAELIRRYFRSHGPATVKDFVWWSGLTVADANAGIEMVKSEFGSEVIDGKTYWFSAAAPIAKLTEPVCYLLPNYDEGLASYEDRSASTASEYLQLWSGEGNVLAHHLVIDGRVVGSWRRTFKKRTVILEIRPFETLTPPQERALEAAADRYREFLGMASLEMVRS
jgi:hypothetical protein